MSKNCLIHQPIGLGDIFFVQGIVRHLINQGYTVHYPVHDFYYDVVSSYIKTDGLIWYRENENYPLSDCYGYEKQVLRGEDMYLPLTWADCYKRTQPMISKYFYADVPVDDWRKGLNIERNYEREKLLMDMYKISGEYVIVNKYYHQPPHSNYRDIDISTDLPVHEMSYEVDNSFGFNLFDWIGAIENASEIHTVGTSVAYLVDKYANTDKLYCYERRLPGQDRTYHEEIHLTHRNPNWIYMD
jgi:hypothetical protein